MTAVRPDAGERDAAWRAQVRDFARTRIAPLSGAMDRAAALDPALRKALFEQGLMAVEAPTRYGGVDGSLRQTAIAIEEIARVDSGVAVAVDVQNALIVATLLRQGSGDQRRRHLPQLATGRIGAFALSEEGAGSDAFNLATTAEPASSGGWLLTGRKRWTSNGDQADLYLVFARVPERGISAFLVDREASGLSVVRRTEQMGVRAAATADVVLDRVAVRDTDCLGGVGRGKQVAVAALDIGRIGIAAQLVGLAQGALDLAANYSREREQFGRAIGSFQAVRFALAETATELAAARALLHEAIVGAEADTALEDRLRRSAMAKLFASRVAERAASRAVELLGGNGYTSAYPAERFYRDAKAGAIYEGTTHVLLDRIAASLPDGAP